MAREREVTGERAAEAARLKASGATTRDIAAALGVSRGAVLNHERRALTEGTAPMTDAASDETRELFEALLAKLRQQFDDEADPIVCVALAGRMVQLQKALAVTRAAPDTGQSAQTTAFLAKMQRMIERKRDVPASEQSEAELAAAEILAVAGR